ncbi:MAG: type IX secretion system outer membrane channel protein PorV [Prevotellaceae bacterium]|nr:type IX secretion system outer membrane channel protein PorV [Prevotellaceae bacterium]
MKKILILSALICLLQPQTINGQNAIRTAANFLSIAPDARAASMGDVGVSTGADANSQHWNVAKYIFAESNSGISLSYTPWMRNYVNDINLGYLSGYYKFDENQSVSASLRFLSNGDVYVRNDFEQLQLGNSANELAFDLGYSRRLSDKFSAGIELRYIRAIKGAEQGKALFASGFAGDVALYYQSPLSLFNNPSTLAFGLNISNIGTKIANNNGSSYFLPTNLRLGGSITMNIKNNHQLAVAADINKLMVPSPTTGEDGTVSSNADKSMLGGLFSSFGDADGGFKEELKEIALGVGIEYKYLKTFAIRGGCFYEDNQKGMRRYFTFGCGYSFKLITLDISYLSTYSGVNHPLDNTFRLTLSVNLSELK